MSGKVFAIVVVLLAVVVGILACVMPISHIMSILIIMKFFNAMLPILGVGALVKYIMCCHSHGNGKCQ